MNKKPTRHECGVGILGFWGMNLKSIQINHRHAATRTTQTSIPSATILAYGQGVGLDVQLFLFNRGDCIVAREFSLWIKNKAQYLEIDKSLNGCKATIGAFIFIKKTINTKSANNRSVRIRKRKALNGYLLSLLNNIF